MAKDRPEDGTPRSRSILDALAAFRGTTTSAITWGQVEAEDVMAVVDAAVNAGMGITLSRTQSGKTLTMTLLEGKGNKRSYYFDDPVGAREELLTLRAMLEEITGV